MYADYFEQETRIEPLRKQVKVRLQAQAAFELFTEGIGRWWPLAAYSVGAERAEKCAFEGWVGGRIFEVLQDGSQSEWGRVLSWEPYRKVRFHWYPGRKPDTAQEVTVTFTETEGGTLVELLHVGWETLGEEAQATRRGYDAGWDAVLARYVIQAENG